MIDFYIVVMFNGYKVFIVFEELGLFYMLKVLDLLQNEQKIFVFLVINFNGCILVFVDCEVDDFVVFELGVCLIYLVEKIGWFMFLDVKGCLCVLQWLMFQMGGIGLMMGQVNVFFCYFFEKILVVIDCYQGESKCLFCVFDGQLKDYEYLVGDYFIVDIVNWVWVCMYCWLGVDMDDLLYFKCWCDVICVWLVVQCGIEQLLFRVDFMCDGDVGVQCFVEDVCCMVEMGQSLKGVQL